MRKVTDEEFRISSVMIGFVDQSDVNGHSCKNRMNNSIATHTNLPMNLDYR